MSSIDVRVCRRRPAPPWWGPIAAPVLGVVRAIPTHRDTRTGRRNATQVRIILIALGVVTIVLWKSNWSLLGFIPAAGALLVPLSERTQRSWIASLRDAKRRTRVDTNEGSILRDGDLLRVTERGEPLREFESRKARLRTNQHGAALGTKKKADEIQVVQRGQTPPDTDLWLEVDAPPAELDLAAL